MKFDIYNNQLDYIQRSHRFLGPKFKIFWRLFSKTIISFSRLKVIKWVINRELKKKKKKNRNKAFFMMRCKRLGEIE